MGGNGKREVAFEGLVNIDDAVEQLQSVLKGMQSGTLCVQQGSRTITVHPDKEIEIFVKVKTKDERESVSIEMQWKPVAAARIANEFRILDREPNQSDTTSSGDKAQARD
jgi:amphi-Trp domain-containing protein